MLRQEVPALPNEFLIMLVCGYLIGSIPARELVEFARRCGVGRNGLFGKINAAIGAVARDRLPEGWTETVLDTWPVVLLNLLKGVAAVLLARTVVGSLTSMVSVGIMAIWGHTWPVFLRFRSERGTATILGVSAIVAPITTSVWAGVWLLVFGVTRFSAVASVASFAAFPLLMWWVKHSDLMVFFGVICSLTAAGQLYGSLQRVFEGKSKRADEGGSLSEADAEEEEEQKSPPVRQSRLKARAVLACIALLAAGLWFANKYVYRGFGLQVPIIRAGGPYYKVVALTFDDGPDPVYTPQILDVLKKNNVKATFFIVGRHAEKYPAIVRQIAADGHNIGNHSETHPINLVMLSKEKIAQEVIKAEEAIYRACGIRPYLFRPPRGLYNKALTSLLRESRYTLVLWSLSSRDWQEPSYKEIVWRITTGIKNGDILLFHDSGSLIVPEGGSRESTVAALPYVIKELRDKGYRFVTIQDLIIMSDLNGSIE
ncbi:MAG: glycerol-3-phosphate acyltransferase [Bacillota bacterium]|nr:glycerol-3-phosphate acyltransferase [Bacillota bacterium]